jgi:hypothetical protein
MQPRMTMSWKRLSDNAPPGADSISQYNSSLPHTHARETQLQKWETDGGKTAPAKGPQAREARFERYFVKPIAAVDLSALLTRSLT